MQIVFDLVYSIQKSGFVSEFCEDHLFSETENKKKGKGKEGKNISWKGEGKEKWKRKGKKQKEKGKINSSVCFITLRTKSLNSTKDLWHKRTIKNYHFLKN